MTFRAVQEAFEHVLGPVLAEERRRGVPLVETLRVFLDHGRRPRPAATALAIHVNTLYQRLAAADRLLGEGWRSRSGRWSCTCSCTSPRQAVRWMGRKAAEPGWVMSGSVA
jgi:hypothetical protein